MFLKNYDSSSLLMGFKALVLCKRVPLRDEVTALQERLQMLGAHRGSDYWVTCSIYQVQPSADVVSLFQRSGAAPALRNRVPPNPLEIFSFSNTPGKVYITNNENVLEAEDSLKSLIDNTRYMFESRQIVRFQGPRYDMGDFVVCIGGVSIVHTRRGQGDGRNRGYLLEVEYCPSFSMKESFPLIEEFLSSVLPPEFPAQPTPFPVEFPSATFGSRVPHLLGLPLSDPQKPLYSLRHAAWQYLSLFRKGLKLFDVDAMPQ